jgi:hypothetical protein
MKQCGCSYLTDEQLDRRGFLRVGSLSLLGLGLSEYLLAEKVLAETAAGITAGQTKAEACILVWLEGGVPQMDTWDPKPNSNFKPISTNVPGIQVSELMPRLAEHMDKLALVRTVQTKERNHPQAGYEAMTGHRPTIGEKFPSLGSIICKETGPRNEMPQYVLVPRPWDWYFPHFKDGFSSGFMGAEYDPMVVPDPSKDDFQMPDLVLPKSLTPELIEHRQSFLKVVDQHLREKERLGELGNMDETLQTALAMLASDRVKKAFDLSQESEKTRETYGRDQVGQSMLLARRMVEAGCRFVTASGYKYAQWDIHKDNDKQLKEDLVPTLDRSLSALLEDLHQRGLLETTLVVVMSEFGRTPDINGGLGRDHWPDCWSLAMAGGGIKGGQVIGSSDERAAHVEDRLVSLGDVYATIYKAFGIDYTKTYTTPFGRPIYIANALDDRQGEPLNELV